MSTLTMEASTALWPPDWSQTFPDLIVAIATGLAVGLAVLIVELSIEARRKRAEIGIEQRSVSEDADDILRKPIAFEKASAFPIDERVNNLATDVRKVRSGEPDSPTAGYLHLMLFAIQWKYFQRFCEDLDTHLATFPTDAACDAQVRLAIARSIETSDGTFDFGELDKHSRAAIESDVEFLRIARDYRTQRFRVELMRAAYYETRTTYSDRSRGHSGPPGIGASAKSAPGGNARNRSRDAVSNADSAGHRKMAEMISTHAWPRWD